MLAFLVQRISQAFLVMFVISVIAFAIQDGLGDPLQEMVGMSVSEEEREAIRDELGLNDSMVVQYLRFAGNAIQGDLGNSYFYSKPTLEVIAEHLPATLELVIGASLIIVFLSVPIGVYAAIRPQAWLSKFFMGVSTVGISIPVFLTAIVLIQLFSIGVTVSWFPVETSWGQWLNEALSTEGGLPSYGRGDDLVHLFGTWESGFFSSGGLMHLVLPSVSLASIMLPLFIRLIRAEMMEVLQSDYIRYARANTVALAGHRAAQDAFVNGESEFGISLAYQQATRQREADAPYHSIIGLNAHAGTLHYQYYDIQPPRPPP